MVAKTQPNPIKIIKLINGDDIVCTLPAEQLGDKSPLLRLSKPLQVKYIPQFTAQGLKDYVALIKWSPYTKDFVLTIPKDKIMTITNASNEMTVSYGQIVKNYDSLDKPKKDENYMKKEFTPEDNKKLNEIFREFDDEEDEPTLH